MFDSPKAPPLPTPADGDNAVCDAAEAMAADPEPETFCHNCRQPYEELQGQSMSEFFIDQPAEDA